MDQFHREDSQGFLLRFWYEPSQVVSSHWRGTIWHQQDPERAHRPVDGPEEAFEIVRRALTDAAPSESSSQSFVADLDQSGNSHAPSPSLARTFWAGIMRFFQRILSRRSR